MRHVHKPRRTCCGNQLWKPASNNRMTHDKECVGQARGRDGLCKGFVEPIVHAGRADRAGAPQRGGPLSANAAGCGRGQGKQAEGQGRQGKAGKQGVGGLRGMSKMGKGKVTSRGGRRRRRRGRRRVRKRRAAKRPAKPYSPGGSLSLSLSLCLSLPFPLSSCLCFKLCYLKLCKICGRCECNVKFKSQI